MLTRPLLAGRGPFAQKIYLALPRDGVQATITGRPTVLEDIARARERGNDCIIIATAASSHLELLRVAFETKLPVFCEKPLVLSAEEGVEAEACWRNAGCPPFICDFTRLWTKGFEYAVTMRSLNASSHFTAVFGGNVQRKDVHPVWDYGSHPIALALALGIDLRGLKCEPCIDCPYEWTLSNKHASIHINANPPDSLLPQKYARVLLHDQFTYEDGLWCGFPPTLEGAPIFDDVDDPPLQRALLHFLEQRSDPFGRTGMALPIRVTQVLSSVCSSKSPF